MITPVTEIEGAQESLDTLQKAIEALADKVEHIDVTNYFRGWHRTFRGKLFTTICNGVEKAELAPVPVFRAPKFVFAGTLREAKRLRKQVKGPTLLTWRDFTYTEKNLWVRLAFEPLPELVQI